MKTQKSSGDNLPLRSLSLSLGTASLLGVIGFVAGYRSLSIGFGIGALLSLFSLWTLAVCIPALVRPGAGSLQRISFALLLWVKLPIFIAGLYLASQLGTRGLAGAVAGIALCPMTIALLTVRDALKPSHRTEFVPLEISNTSDRKTSLPTAVPAVAATERG